MHKRYSNMKHKYFIGALFAAVLVPFSGCKNNRTLEITDFVHSDFRDDPDIQEHKGCFDYDSVTFSDGSYAVKRLSYAPQNRLKRYVDKNGRLTATISGASEAFDQILVYSYDGNGRLTHLLRFDEKLEPTFYDEDTDSAYLHFRLAIDSIDFDRPDTTRHTLSRLVYDDDGHAREVHEIPSGKVIQAPDGYRLEVNVDPCADFWDDDLDGGRYLFKVDIVPVSEDIGTYSVRRFVDFIPTTEEYYRDGERDSIVCHPNPRYSSDVRMTKKRQTENGANIYFTEYEGSSDTLIHVWKEGLLREEIRKSRYGTVLNAVYYNYLPSGKARREEMRYDYKSKTLKPASSEFLELSDLPSEEEEMNPLAGLSWREVYLTGE